MTLDYDAMRIVAAREQAISSTSTVRPKWGLRAFLLRQASDPILAIASAPATNRFFGALPSAGVMTR